MVTNRTRLLSGLLKCSACGSSVVSAGSDYGRPIARCSRVAESGDCSNRRRVYLDTIETAVIDGLRERLHNPALISTVVQEYHAERRRLAAAGAAEGQASEKRPAEIRSQLERLVDAIADGSGTMSTLGRRIAELETEEARLTSAIKQAEADVEVVTMHPKAIASYMAEIDRLASAVRDREHETAFAIVRRLVDRIVIYPREKGEPVAFDIVGRLAALIDPSVGPLVPRGGIEPPTLRFSVACSTN